MGGGEAAAWDGVGALLVYVRDKYTGINRRPNMCANSAPARAKPQAEAGFAPKVLPWNCTVGTILFFPHRLRLQTWIKPPIWCSILFTNSDQTFHLMLQQHIRLIDFRIPSAISVGILFKLYFLNTERPYNQWQQQLAVLCVGPARVHARVWVCGERESAACSHAHICCARPPSAAASLCSTSGWPSTNL